MVVILTTIIALAGQVLAHADHDQAPLAGPHKSLWYNALPGDGGTQADAVFSGISTFGRLPYFPCLSSDEEKFDIAFLGAPFDTGTSYRPGARFGPSGIRQGSRRLNLYGGYNVPLDTNPFDSWARVLDCGDIPVTSYDNSYAIQQIEEGHNALLSRQPSTDAHKKGPAKHGKTLPRIITLGGDHTITLPLLRSVNRNYGPISVIHFDSHLDTWKPKVFGGAPTKVASINHGTYFYHAAQEGLLANDTNIHAGIRTTLSGLSDYENDGYCGFEIVEAREIDNIGVQGIIKKIRERVGTSDPVYLSIDIDTLDPAFAPATGTPETGGWSTREMRTIIRGLEGINFIAADIVEVAPAYDTNAELSTMAAADILYEVMSLMNKKGPLSNTIEQDEDELSSHICITLAPSPYSSRPRQLGGRPRNAFVLLRYLFPHTRQRARARLFDFRHETLPYYRQRAQSRIYRFIVRQQSRSVEKRKAGRAGVLAQLGRRGQRILFRTRSGVNNVGVSRKGKMMIQPGASEEMREGDRENWRAGTEGKERGARRRKLAGYLKAANELRQSYAQSSRDESGHGDFGANEDDQGIPGAFPDVSVVRSGDEEMVLFPSYAKKHVKKERSQQPRDDLAQAPGDNQNGRQRSTADQADYWRREWEKHEDDKAVVDVDIRGWIYSPHRGPLTRKNRVLIGLARQLSGIPAPASNNQGGGQGELSADVSNKHLSHEEKLVEREAESIMKKGEGEADVAWRGGYSEAPSDDLDKVSIYSKDSRSSTPDAISRKDVQTGQLSSPLSKSSLVSEKNDASAEKATRASWIQPANMSPKELAIANTHMMTRLKPFLTNPLPNVPITMFFYSDKTSQSRTTMTNEAGHFSERFALDFVPSNVRVLASESLSATEDVRVTETHGVSLISDIDDTIKHSAIGSGAREIFRNTFIRDLGDLTIEGVTEWYKRLSEMGVKLHYVSNSPWQLYPLLVSYFSLAGLPPGSFHLKQYSGMLQGIFEPVAERKKSTLEKIMYDFPERRFVLVGDSGEADLEVYTDVVLANPGRIIGVFIRDVTTPKSQGFFDSAMGPLTGSRNGSSAQSRSGDKGQETDEADDGRKSRPPVPPRRSVAAVSEPRNVGPTMGKLIDFEDEELMPSPTSFRQSPPPLNRSMTDSGSDYQSERVSSSSDVRTRQPPPPRPSKPSSLRGRASSGSVPTVNSRDMPRSDSGNKPNPPPKPRRYSNAQPQSSANVAPPNSSTKPPSLSGTTGSYVPGNIRQKVSSAYNRLPAAGSLLSAGTGGNSTFHSVPQSSLPSQHSHTRSLRPSLPIHSATKSNSYAPSSSPSTNASPDKTLAPPPPPPPPARRNLSSYPAAAAHYATNRIGWSGASNTDPNNTSTSQASSSYSTFGNNGNGNNPGTGGNVPINKKEELWKRRWARAREILASKGVELRSWRVGEDVVEDSVRLVERAMRQLKEEEKKKATGR